MWNVLEAGSGQWFENLRKVSKNKDSEKNHGLVTFGWTVLLEGWAKKLACKELKKKCSQEASSANSRSLVGRNTKYTDGRQRAQPRLS